MVTRTGLKTVTNAPAGSGKTTRIATRISEFLKSNPYDQILCITYTNRGADELLSKIPHDLVDIMTIHSFFAKLSSSLFAQPQIIDFYLKLNRDDIVSSIENLDGDKKFEERNIRFYQRTGLPASTENVEKYIRENGLYYTESSYDNLYYGGLSHESLLYFICKSRLSFPSIATRITSRYRKIIIDEYQDTNIDVLTFFSDICSNSCTDLNLFGDPMQQIYPTDLSRFKSAIQSFDKEDLPIVNYRSKPAIVSILNAIYNDRSQVQEANSQGCSTAIVHLCDHPDIEVEEISKTGNFTRLYLSNKQLFCSNNAENLFQCLNRLNQHKFGSDFSAKDALLTTYISDNLNPLIQILYSLIELKILYEKNHIGDLIDRLSNSKYPIRFSKFETHSDKKRLKEALNIVFGKMQASDTIGIVLSALNTSDLISAASDLVENEEYKTLMEVAFDEVYSAYNLAISKVASTQHGVKGEGHDKVVFCASEAHIPNVKTYMLFDYWSHNTISLPKIEDELVEIKNAFSEAVAVLPLNNIGSLKKADFSQSVRDSMVNAVRLVDESLSDNSLYIFTYREQFQTFLQSPNVTKAKQLFKDTQADGIYMAYKLFYVGCSRAKDELHVILDRSKLKDSTASKKLFEQLGFDVKVRCHDSC